MSKTEGVIKFKLSFTEAAPLPAVWLSELNAWRKVLVQMGLIGQDPSRYAGYGYGNISRRLLPDEMAGCDQPFVISGTQTGGLADLSPQHYVSVLACYPAENRVLAQGPMLPSAESMTHGVIYAADPAIGWVMHVHDPYIWRYAAALALPQTHPTVAYGSPEMSAEVVRLFWETDVAERGIFAMAGHEDGVMAFGPTAVATATILMQNLATAIQLAYAL